MVEGVPCDIGLLRTSFGTTTAGQCFFVADAAGVMPRPFRTGHCPEVRGARQPAWHARRAKFRRKESGGFGLRLVDL